MEPVSSPLPTGEERKGLPAQFFALEGLKFLGLCLVAAALIIAIAIVWQAKFNRFKPFSDEGGLYILDSRTGMVYRR